MDIKDNLTLVKTGDGTFSFFSKEYNELMHTREGAYQESLIKHVYPANVLGLKKDKINILDIGFGVGYNLLALLMEQEKGKKYFNIISLEKNKTALPLLRKIKFNDKRDKFYKKILKSFTEGFYINNNFKIKVLFGDARVNLFQLSKKDLFFDAVFHDPFSPAKNPELWTVQYFKLLNKLVTDGAIVSTYSAAPQIRSAMSVAGFKVFKISSMGKKKQGTIASKSSLNEYQEINYSKLLQNSKSIPYQDKDFKLNKEDILNNRIKEIKLKKQEL